MFAAMSTGAKCITRHGVARWQQYVFSLTLIDLCINIRDTAEVISDEFALGTPGVKNAPFSTAQHWK